MNNIELLQPRKIVFGVNTIQQVPLDCKSTECRSVLWLVAQPLTKNILPLSDALVQMNIASHIFEYNQGEPTIDCFNTILSEAKKKTPDCIIGVGGGSVLDLAKLVAALIDSKQTLHEIFGNGNLNARSCKLICVPTTAGTGSEVSPNAILLEDTTQEKIGTISPFLIPDSCYIDPTLAVGLPPAITAETAMDALSHCIESYTNKNSHPIIDVYALAGIRLINENLETAYNDGNNIDARSALALASMYGGLCLGPVNTAAVHALSYGLGGKFHISHGLSNAILLAEVMKFNMQTDTYLYSQIATQALGIPFTNEEETATLGIMRIIELSKKCGIPQKLSQINICANDIEDLAARSMKITRLLNNNRRTVTKENAIEIFHNLL